jgi:hypothetical protein
LWLLDGHLSAQDGGFDQPQVFRFKFFRSVFFHQPAEPFERLLPHPAASRALCGISEPAVFQGKHAAAGTTQKLHVNHGFRGGDGRSCLPDVPDLIFTNDPARTIYAGLKGFAAIEIDAKCLFCYLIEDEPQVIRIRGLQPGFDIFRDAERIEYAAAVGLELKGKGYVPLVLAGDHRHHSGVDPKINVGVRFCVGQSVHFISPHPHKEKAFHLPNGLIVTLSKEQCDNNAG